MQRGAYQVVIDTLVELPLSRAALPELMISVVKTLPVLAEFGEAVSVDVLDPVAEKNVSERLFAAAATFAEALLARLDPSAARHAFT